MHVSLGVNCIHGIENWALEIGHGEGQGRQERGGRQGRGLFNNSLLSPCLPNPQPPTPTP